MFVAGDSAPQIRSRPGELIPFGNDYPRSVHVETQSMLHRRRNLDSNGGRFRLAMCDREHQYAGVAVLVGADGRNDRARTVLPALLPAFEVFPVPEITIADDETRNGFGQRHALSFQLGIERGELVRHFCVAHRLHPLLGKFRAQARPAVAALQTGIFISRQHDEMVSPFFRNGHGLL